MRIDAEFSTASPGSLARFLWARVPFRVIDSKESAGRELVVDLDDFAILDGSIPIDMSQFGKVMFKQRGTSISSLDAMNTGHRSAEYRCFQLPLKPNLDLIHLEPPRVSERFRSRHYQDSATLVFQDGSRTLLLAKKKVKWGRQKKTNDIVLRFLPPSDHFNKLSLAISKEHVTMELTENGLSLKSEGAYGTTVNRTSTELIVLRVDDYAEERIDLQLGSDPIQVEEPFPLELQLFRWEHQSGDQRAWGDTDQWYFDAVGARPSSTYQVAQAASVDAIRIRRKTNLPQEEYVLVFRQALIGSSHRCAIYVPGLVNARILYIGRCFWLENLGEASSIRVQGESLPPRELVALVPAMALTFGQTSVSFENFAQLHL